MRLLSSQQHNQKGFFRLKLRNINTRKYSNDDRENNDIAGAQHT